MAKTDQELAQEEVNNRQYMYGGTGPFSQFLSGERREILSPESTQVAGFAAGPSGVEYITETIPAQYGPAEYDPSYSPVRRGLSTLSDYFNDTGEFLGDVFFGDATEQAEAIQGVGSSLRDALFGTSEYMSEQARAAASGGEYFDPETGRIVAFDPTITMFGGNPAEGAVLGSGVRAGRVGSSASRLGRAESDGSDLREFGGAIPEVDRDTELLMRVGDPRSVNEMPVEMTDPVISSAPIVSAEDLVDRPFITGMSDTSRSGLETVTSVNDVPVNAVMRGGKYFGLQPQNLERGIAFASAPGAVMGQLNRAEAAQALGGRPVAFIPFGMRPASPDFATMSTDIMVPYAQQVMSRSDKIALDRRIREGKGKKEDEMRPIPDWVGIDNATPEYLQALGGGRKVVTKALDEFRDAGSLSRSQVRAIVTDPTQFEPVFGDIDMIYELNPQAVANRRFLDSDHPSYESALLGRPLGALRDTEKVNIFEFNPLAGTQDKGFYNFRQKQLDAGRDFPIGGSLSSPTMKAFLPGGHGIITREMVDDLIRRGLVRP